MIDIIPKKGYIIYEVGDINGLHDNKTSSREVEYQ